MKLFKYLILALACPCLALVPPTPTNSPAAGPDEPDYIVYELNPTGDGVRIEYKYVDRVIYKEPSFTSVSITVSNTVSGTVKTAFMARVSGDHRFWTVVNTNDVFILKERDALDQPFYDSFMTTGLGSNWVIHTFEAYSFPPKGVK